MSHPAPNANRLGDASGARTRVEPDSDEWSWLSDRFVSDLQYKRYRKVHLACYNLTFDDNKSRDALLNSFIEARNTYKRLQQGTSKQDEFVSKLDEVAESKKKLWECEITDEFLVESEELDDGGIWLGWVNVLRVFLGTHIMQIKLVY